MLAAAGAALIAISLLWSLALPLSKRLWTGSYALLSIGLALTILAALIGYVDVAKLRFGVGFFEVFGKNPLVIYLFSELFIETLQVIPAGGHDNPYTYVGWRVFQAAAPGALGSLACAVAYMLLCWLVGYGLKRADLVIRL